MLTAFRNSIDSIIVKIILVLLIASFAVWGIEDMLVSRPGQEEIAKIGNVTLSRVAVEAEMQRDIEQLRRRMGAEYKPELLKLLNIPEQVTTRMVTEELLKQETKALGLVASDEFVAELIRTDQNFQNELGKFDKKLFLRLLRQNGLSEREFVAIMREDIARRLVGQSISGVFNVPDIAVQVMQAARNEKRDVTIYQVNDVSENVAEPNDEELNAYYQSVSDRYVIPEYRTISYTTIDQNDVASEAIVPEEEIQTLYEERLNEYQVPETRDIQLLLYTGKEDAEKAGAMLKEGKKSSDIVKEIPSVNAANTTMEKVTPARLPDELKEAVFNLAAGEVSPAIASGFGFHVIKIDKVNASTTKSFDEVKTSLENELKSALISNLLTEKADALEDLLAGGSTLSEAAKELKLNVKNIGPFSRAGEKQGGGRITPPELKNFVPLAFSVPEGEASSISLGRPGLYYLVQTDEVIAEQLPPIDSVRAELVASWKASKKDTLYLQHAKTLVAKLTDAAEREKLLADKSIKKLGSSTMHRDTLKFGTTTLPAQVVQSIFTANIGDTTPAHKLSNGKFIVAYVESSIIPPLSDDLDSDEAKQIRTNIQSNQQQELMAQLMEYLHKKYEVQINREALATIGQDAGSY